MVYPLDDYIVREIPVERFAEWDRFVLAQRDGTIFHTSHWLKHQPGRKLRVFGLYYREELIGGWPMLTRKALIFRLIVQPYMTPYYGPVVSDRAVLTHPKKEIAKTFLDTAKRFDAFRLSFPAQAHVLASGMDGLAEKIPLRSHILPHSDADQVGDDLMPALQRNLRKAGNSGLSVSETDDFDMIYALSLESFRHSGKTPPLDARTFRELADGLHVGGLAKGYAAHLPNGTPVSACWCPRDGRFAYNIIHGIDRKHADTQSGALVLFHAVTDSMEAGLGFDFEGSMHERISRFYRKFGAKPVEVAHYRGIQSPALCLLDRLRIKRV